jgi:hypothetical protein
MIGLAASSGGTSATPSRAAVASAHTRATPSRCRSSPRSTVVTTPRVARSGGPSSQVGREHLGFGAQGLCAFGSACAVVLQSGGLAVRHFRTHDLGDVLVGQSTSLGFGDADTDRRRLDR